MRRLSIYVFAQTETDFVLKGVFALFKIAFTRKSFWIPTALVTGPLRFPVPEKDHVLKYSGFDLVVEALGMHVVVSMSNV